MKQEWNGNGLDVMETYSEGDLVASLGKTRFDPIINPAHYCQGDIEPWEFIEAQRLGFHEGSAVQYIARARHKGDEIADLRKAINMLSRKVKLLEKEKSAGK